MSNNNIRLEGYEELQKKLGAILRLVKSPKEIMGKTATKMLQDVQRHFRESESPEGKWKNPLFRQGKPLLNTGRNLEGTITTDYDDKSARVGTNAIMAAIHNFGGTIKAKKAKWLMFPINKKEFVRVKQVDIPKRQFMWLSDTAEEQIIDVFVKGLEEV